MKRKCILIFLILIGWNLANAQNKTAITKKDFKKHIGYLASEELKGREPGTPGDLAAAEYIRDRFDQAGLELMGENGLQYFEVVKGVDFGENNSVQIGDSVYILNKKFVPLSFSGNGQLNAEVVFAGYGFTIAEDSLQWDDYKSIEVTGKWVMIFRADPDLDNAKSPFVEYSSDRYKVMNALDHGAAGVILVNTVDFDKSDGLEKLQRRKSAAPTSIPVFQVTRSVANHLLSETGQQIEELEKWIAENKSPKPVAINKIVKGKVELLTQKAQTMNVVAYLPGTTDEFIIVGGHYDHLGMGGQSSRIPDTVAVHYGADDNASGTAVVIEMAQKLAKEELDLGVLFMAFGAEEMGLLGSNYFVEHPLLDLDKAKIMLNFDMMGRLNEERSLMISGTGTAIQMDSLISVGLDSNKYAIVKSPGGTGPSDHSSFYAKNIPVLFFSTGVHDDYHIPADHFDAINFDGIEQLGNDLYDFMGLLMDDEQTLTFQKAGNPNDKKMRRAMKVTLGIVPDFASQVEGLGVAGVREGRPAANGGMEKGDVIVAIEGKTITNIYDYMFRMGKFEEGQLITVEVKRGDENKVLIITL